MTSYPDPKGDPIRELACGDCRHPWRAHRGRNGGERCYYEKFAGHPCGCRTKNPQIEAEERHAAALWNAYMGRPTPRS